MTTPANPSSLAPVVGLCLTCRWKRVVENRRGSVFLRCARSDVDARFARYPVLPVRSCPGYEDAMLFVVLMHYTRPLADVDAIRPDHVAHLERQAGRGVILAWARRDPPVGAVLVALAPDRATLERALAEDPYIQGGVANPEIVEFPTKNVRIDLRGVATG
jgi:uncharacterized protein YciI